MAKIQQLNGFDRLPQDLKSYFKYYKKLKPGELSGDPKVVDTRNLAVMERVELASIITAATVLRACAGLREGNAWYDPSEFEIPAVAYKAQDLPGTIEKSAGVSFD